MATMYYVLQVVQDIEPVLHGPYKTRQGRDKSDAIFNYATETKGPKMKWKKHGKWVRMEDKDFNSLRWRLSNFARSLPFNWKEALVCWPIAIVLIFILIFKHH